MSAINHILVPTDGSQGAINAAAYAGQLAKALGANVTILCVQSDDNLLASAWGQVSFMRECQVALNQWMRFVT